MLLALLGVVAVASRGGGASGGGEPGSPSSGFWDYVFTGTIVLGIVSVALGAWALVTGRGGKVPAAARRSRHVSSLFAFTLMMIALAVVIRQIEPGRERPADRATPTLPTLTAEPRERRRPPERLEFKWVPVAVLASLLAAGAAGAYASRRLTRRAARPGAAQLAAELAQLVDDTLDDLRSEPDPRRAVVAAYARMERVLAAHGLARRPAEAPLEYLDRVASALSSEVPSARGLVFELTALYERAKFSHHPVDTAMKDDAIETLTELRDELRATLDRAAREPSGTPA